MTKLLSLCALLLAAGVAHADGTITGYPCKTAWWPLSGGGNYGTVYTYVYSGPRCEGSQVGVAYFCTTGATNGSICAPQQLTELQASTLSQNLQRAAAEGQRVQVYTYSTLSSAGYAVEFAFH